MGEVIDGVAVDIGKVKRFNRKRRLQDHNDIRDICIGLIDIDSGSDPKLEDDYETKSRSVIRIAHFSVQEYLRSERIRHQKAAMFKLTSVTAHGEIAQMRLIYLVDHILSNSSLDQSLLEAFPLARFAALYWYHHCQSAAHHIPGLEESILNLFQHQNSFVTWVKLHDVDTPWRNPINLHRSLEDIPAPVYYASLLGIDQILHKLINNEELEITTIPAPSLASTSNVSKRVNAQGGRHGHVLQAAAFGGYSQVVQMLLDKGADINAQGGKYGNALQAASFRGFVQMVRSLLNNGANINTRGGYFGTALHAASYGGHIDVVQILVNRGADIDAQDKDGCHALHIAAANGRVGILDCLTTHGANTTLCDNQMKSVLHHGICGQTFDNGIETVQWLLAHQIAPEDADIDNMTPLHLAVKSNRDDIAGLLLQHNYSVDIGVERKLWLRRYENELDCYYLENPFHEYGTPDVAGLTPLHAAALFGRSKMVGFLLDHKANPNAIDRISGTPLHLALKGSIGQPETINAWSDSRNYLESSLDDLIDDPSADDTDIYDYVLEAREATINLLLDCETTNVTIKKEGGQTILHELQYGKRNTRNDITRILAKGADINAKNNQGETPSSLAAREGDYEAFQEYLSQGADPLVEDNCGRTLLHSAAEGYSRNDTTLSIIKLLLKHQATVRLVHSVDKISQNALHRAVGKFIPDVKIIEHLIDSGVDTNAIDNEGRTPLLHYITSAPLSFEVEVIRLLASDSTAQVNDTDGMFLAHRVVKRLSPVNPELFQILEKYGVCINAIDHEGRTVIHHAAIAATLDDRLLRCLLNDWGLDIEKRDDVDMTALDYATEKLREGRVVDCYQAYQWDQIIHTLRIHGARGS